MDSQLTLRAEGVARHFRVAKGVFSSKASGYVQAVDGVSLSLQPGRTVGLVGESGCGKSTIARLLLNLEKPTSGKCFLGDEDIQQLRGRRLARYRQMVQAVYQNPYASLNPHRRVRHAVAEPLVAANNYSRSEIRELVYASLERVGFSKQQGNNYPHEFSGGQRQRIAIASALASKPSFVVLDEPVSALDVSIGAQILNLFRDLQEELGLSYLLISHDLAATSYMASEVAVMYLGRLVEYGQTDDVFARPRHPYTKSLLAASLPSHPSKRSSKLIIRGEVPSPMNPPTGCSFHPRCPWSQPGRCDVEAPVLRMLRDGSSAACHFAEEIAEGQLSLG